MFAQPLHEDAQLASTHGHVQKLMLGSDGRDWRNTLVSSQVYFEGPQDTITSAPRDDPHLPCPLWSPHLTQVQIIPRIVGGSLVQGKEWRCYSKDACSNSGSIAHYLGDPRHVNSLLGGSVSTSS